MERLPSVLIGTSSLREQLRQLWIGNKSPAQHHPLHCGKLVLKLPKILCRKDISIVAHGMPAQQETFSKGLPVHRLFVKVPEDARMDDDL